MVAELARKWNRFASIYDHVKPSGRVYKALRKQARTSNGPLKQRSRAFYLRCRVARAREKRQPNEHDSGALCSR